MAQIVTVTYSREEVSKIVHVRDTNGRVTGCVTEGNMISSMAHQRMMEFCQSIRFRVVCGLSIMDFVLEEGLSYYDVREEIDEIFQNVQSRVSSLSNSNKNVKA